MLILPRRKLLAGGVAAAAYNRLLIEEASACDGVVTTPPTGIPIPAQATAAGFTAVKIFDDFNSVGTVDETGSTTSGKTWYPASDYGNKAGHCTADGSVSINGTVTNNAAIKANGNGMPVANITVYPNATAAGITNGNSGGGFQPSPNGGICTINSSTGSAGLGGVASMRSVAASTINNSIPTSGVITDGYLEICMQFQPLFVCPGQWTALVLYVQKDLVVPGQTLLCSQELDWLESSAGNNGFVGNLSLRNTSSAHCFTTAGQPFAGGNTYGTGQDNNNVPNGFTQITQDKEFHLFGYLKKSTGANAGYVQVYYDNVLVNLYNITNPILTGTSCPTTGPNSGWNWAEYFQYYLAISACFFASGTNQASSFATSGNSATLLTPNLNIDYIRLLV